MSFLDKAKEKASQLTQQAKDKYDDVKDSKKSDALLDDLGRITYRQRTERGEAGDDAAIADLVGQLQALEAAGANVLGSKEEPEQTPDLAPPAAPMAPPPMPEPG